MNCFIVVDFEATCDKNERLARSKMEIIEIGAIKLRIEDFTIVDKFQSFVKPVRTPVLTEFCKDLTGIKQTDLSTAPTFYDAIEQFFYWSWLNSNTVAWASWSMYDFYQLKQDCEHFYVDNEYDCIEHFNLKNMYGDAHGGRRRGIKNALYEQSLDFEGSHHRALDDALNATKIITSMPLFKRNLNKLLMELV